MYYTRILNCGEHVKLMLYLGIIEDRRGAEVQHLTVNEVWFG